MEATWKVWAIRIGIFLATCLGVFVLPFLLPPPYFQGVSASNLAGFNNRVAAVAAAGMALVVFLLALAWPQIAGVDGTSPGSGEGFPYTEESRLSRSLVAVVALFWGTVVSLAGIMIIRMGITFPGDWGYFINRVSMHADFGRKLYTQIEFPYGPLLFYGPIAVRTILSPFHISAAGAYLMTLTLEIVVGILLVAYVIDHLPMSRKWKAVIFLLLAGGMLPMNMGLNYTFFRFATPLAFLVMASRRRRPWAAVLWILVGQAVCLGLSPEIGFAFFVNTFGYAAYRCFVEGWIWAAGLVAPILSTAAFLLLVGRPYLHMVELFAHGAMSLPVEPLPHILIYLFALVWLVPICLARFFRQRQTDAPMLAALCLVSLALLPSAFGRADPWHVYWNGLAIFLLSAVEISSRRISQQIAWGGSMAVLFVWMCSINLLVSRGEIGPLVHGSIAEMKGRPIPTPGTDFRFDLQSLQAIVGHDSVVLPEWLPLQVETSLRAAGQYTPTFYYFQTAILDANAEDREIEELNQSKWTLIPQGTLHQYYEHAEEMKESVGFQLPYRSSRPIYAIGLKFDRNLQRNWKVQGHFGKYLVYENVGACHGCGQGYRLAGGM
jgi:hypothetical protein